MRNLAKLWAFLYRDFLSDLSYRLAFLLQFGGMFLSVAAFYFVSKMVNPATAGLDGMAPFPWMLIGLVFQLYFATALYSFSSRIRNEQVLGTLEAMLVSPTPTGIVIFSSAAWDFVFGALRVAVYLGAAVLVFGVTLHGSSLPALAVGIVLTLLSSAGIGILSASFILYFKRGDPINFFLSAFTTFFGNVFFPSQQLPDWLQWISGFVPMSWSLSVVRGSLLQGRPFSDLRGDLLKLALLTAVLLPAGLAFSRIAIRKAKREGTLVQY
jgi:ABC-2 type transport system permease protein